MDCITWGGATDAHGYGVQKVAGQSRLAHRVAYEREIGPIPDGLVIDHLCRVRNCVNVIHMEVVYPRVNTLRGISVPAINAQKAECKYGHEFTTANTLVRSDRKQRQSRRCRTCIAAYRRATRVGMSLEDWFALPVEIRAMSTRALRAALIPA